MARYYTAYITTNLNNNKEYIGVHTTSNLSDAYLGSGTIFKQAVKKHGHDSFNKKIIALFENADYMFAWEAENVTQEIVDDPMFYNMKIGGLGGKRGYSASTSTRTKISVALLGHTVSIATRNKISATHKNRTNFSEGTSKIKTVNRISGMTGKHHSDETREKLRNSYKNRPPITAETRAKISAAMKGKSKSPDHRLSLSNSIRKTKSSKEYCEKIKNISGPNKGKIFSQSTRAKMSAAAKGKPKSIEHRNALSKVQQARIAREKSDK